jgi:hypothetical protein
MTAYPPLQHPSLLKQCKASTASDAVQHSFIHPIHRLTDGALVCPDALIVHQSDTCHDSNMVEFTCGQIHVSGQINKSAIRDRE